MNLIRKQLTLFVDKPYSIEIEKIREKYNPVQFNLIQSHVTLCRENEIENISIIKENLNILKIKPITIYFDKVVRFAEGKGVLIPAHKTNPDFHYLRKEILKNVQVVIDFPEAHITLMHPRNSICTDSIFREIQKTAFPQSITFSKVSLIEQTNGGKWITTSEFALHDF